MSAPYPPAPPRPRTRGVDVGISVALLVLAGGALGLGGLGALLMMAFVDGCTDACDPDALVRNSLLMVGASLVVGIGGGIWTIVRLSRQRTAWPIALVTALAVCACYAIGFTAQFTMGS